MPAGRSRVAVIFFTVLIDLIGFGIVIPIVPYYAKQFGASGFAFGALLGVYSLMQFFAAAVLGRLSDRVGRRPVLLTTMVLNTGGYLLFAFAGSYWALFASRVIGGFAGGNISAAQAYIADSTSAADRSRAIGLLGAAFGLGFVSMARGLADRRLRPLMLVWGIFPFAFAGYTAALPYPAAAAFGWQQKDLALFFIVFGITGALTQGLVFRGLAPRVGERWLVILGTAGVAVAIGAVPFAHSSLVLYAATVALALCQGVVSPAVSGLVSVYASPNEQGTTLGAAQALGALGRTLGPEAIGGAYDAAGARAAFLAAAGVMALAWLATLGLERQVTDVGMTGQANS